MVAAVHSALRPRDEAIVADLADLRLAEPVDAVFSSAVFHWVLDHDALFRSLRSAMRPGARLAAQCGGTGNIDSLRRKSEEVAERDPYAPHLDGFEPAWNYAEPAETEARLRAAGFAEARCWLQPWDVVPPEPAAFVRTACLGPHVDLLPEELRAPFVADVLALEEEPLTLGYVRLNIDARTPPDPL
jgi:trans-aconitate 2-methyltransferase